MVFRDETRKISSANQQEKVEDLDFEHLGAPGDRLAASIVDLSIVLVPLILLASSPFRLIMVRSLLLHKDLEFIVSATAIGLMGFVVAVSYMTIMTTLFGASIGKLVFGLRVINIWDRKYLTVQDAFFRSLVWSGTILVGFLPFLAILSDKKRRPWHDRFANSIVISVGKSQIPSPNLYEKMFVQSILASCGAIAFVIVVFSLEGVYQDLEDSDFLPFSGSDAYAACEEVDLALDEWPKSETVKNDGRLKVVLTLFAAGQVSKSCLEKESIRYFSNESDENSTAYLAQAFVHSDQPSLSNQYLKKVCDLSPESSSCIMSQVVEDWSDSKWTEVESHFASFGTEAPLHIAVWALRHFVKRREFLKAELFLNQLSSYSSLSGFLTEQRLKVLRGLRRTQEHQAVAMTALETSSESQRFEVAEQVCSWSLEDKGCAGASSRHCEVLVRSGIETPTNLLSTKSAIVSARAVVCSGNRDLYKKFRDAVPLQEAFEFAEAYQLKVARDFESAKTSFQDLKSSGDLSVDMERRLNLELLSLANKSELEEKLIDWKLSPPTAEWAESGIAMMNRAIELKRYSIAKDIGEVLVGERFEQASVTDSYLYSLIQTGDSSQAKKVFAKYKQPIEPKASRRIASEANSDEFQNYVRQIGYRFKGSGK